MNSEYVFVIKNRNGNYYSSMSEWTHILPKAFLFSDMEVATRLSKHFKNTFVKIIKLEEVD